MVKENSSHNRSPCHFGMAAPANVSPYVARGYARHFRWIVFDISPPDDDNIGMESRDLLDRFTTRGVTVSLMGVLTEQGYEDLTFFCMGPGGITTEEPCTLGEWEAAKENAQ